MRFRGKNLLNTSFCLYVWDKNMSKPRFLSLFSIAYPTFHDIKKILLLVVPSRFLMNTCPVLEFLNNPRVLGIE
jgi:hypothetical protein